MSSLATPHMEDGGRGQLRMVVGHDVDEIEPQLNIEQMMERALTMIGHEHPRIVRSIDWHITYQGLCRNEECAPYGCFVTTTVSCNPVVLQPCPDGRDSSQEMLNRLMATAESTPRPCPDCSKDMDPRGAQYVQGRPHILVIHARRARHDATRDRGRVEFAERVHIRDDWYRLIAISQYADPEDEASLQGGHYTTYGRRHGGSWVLHDDMYVTGALGPGR